MVREYVAVTSILHKKAWRDRILRMGDFFNYIFLKCTEIEKTPNRILSDFIYTGLAVMLNNERSE